MNCPGACLVFGSERHSYRELPLRHRRVRPGQPRRARGRPARPATGPRLHPGRRPRLLHPGADHRRGDGDLRGDRRALRALRLRRRPGRALDPPGEVDRQRRAVGAGRRRRCARRSRPRGASTSSTRATGPSTGRRSTSTSPTPSAAPGSAAPASSTSSCPSASTSPTPTPTTRRHRPVMIHRALLGSMERFAGILIEHYAGRFPVWLAPVQAIVLPVADRHQRTPSGSSPSCARPGLRVGSDLRSESVGKKIRDAELGRVPLHARGRRPRAGGRLRRGPRPRGGRAGGDGDCGVRRAGTRRE